MKEKTEGRQSGSALATVETQKIWLSELSSFLHVESEVSWALTKDVAALKESGFSLEKQLKTWMLSKLCRLLKCAKQGGKSQESKLLRATLVILLVRPNPEATCNAMPAGSTDVYSPTA